MAVISVFNGAENLESVDLNYDITVSFKNSVDCPTGLNGQICSGRGTCMSELGRCNCNDGYTLDDCGAYGIYQIDIPDSGETSVSVAESDNKFIQPDGWAFYAIPIGCVKQGMHFDLAVDSTSRSFSDHRTLTHTTLEHHRYDLRKLKTSFVCKNGRTSSHD